MKKYKVRDIQTESSWETIKAESPFEASVKFSESLNIEIGEIEVVDNFGNTFTYPIPIEDEGSTDQVSGNHLSTSSPLTDQKLDNIHNQLKGIKWILAIGFLYLMGVISGLIPAGIFG